MILSPYERELIARSVAADRLREAEEIRGRNRVLHTLPRVSRPPVGRAMRQAVGMLLIRAGARLAGLNPRLAPESH